MIFTCSNCGAQYKISDDRIPAKGAKVKCKKCGNIITIKPLETGVEESAAFQNEATVVQRSPFAQEETNKEATRVVSAEQAAGIFKSLIDEHTQNTGPGVEETGAPYSESYTQDSSTQSGYREDYTENPDDRLTSVYEDRSGETAYEEAEQEEGGADGEMPEEDISREATRVVSTEQLRQIVGEEEAPQTVRQDAYNQSLYSQPQQPYVAPRARGEWYVAIGQMQVGPLSLNEVEEKWGRGEINSTTLVWKAGMAGWQPLMYVPELSHLVPPAQESRVEEQPPIKEFEAERKEAEPVSTASTAFPSLDELTRQEEELKSQKEEEPAVDWKPAAGEALASLVQDELESMQRGFSTEIPITPRGSEKIDTLASGSAESPVLPFEKPQEMVSTPPVSTPVISTPPVSTPPVAVEQPVVVTPPYQQSYPPVYPGIYSQPPQKFEKKSYLVPILIAVFGVILIAGGVVAYLLYGRLAGEKVVEKGQITQQQNAPVQPQQQAPANVPQAQQQPVQQPQVAQQPANVQEPQKQEEKQPQVEQPKEEKVEGVAQKETKKESQRQKVAQREEKVEKPSKKRVKEEKQELPPPPKVEKRPQKEEVAQGSVEQETPKKQKPSKGGDSLLDFEGEGSSKGSSGGLPKTLTQEQILEVVKANIGRIKACMAEQAQRDPSVKGKLVIGWDIQPNGKTKNVQIKTPQFKGTYIGTCISSVVSDFNFPKFSGPPIPIEFPFNIK